MKALPIQFAESTGKTGAGDAATVCLVRETKATNDFESSARSEALKARCGQRHFHALGVLFDVAVTADQV